MLRVGICDDNISEIKHIENMLEQFFHTIDAADSEIEVRKYTSGQVLLENNEELDVLFLDIELENENGFDIAKKYQDEYFNTIIVIISSHAEYITESFHYTNVYQFLSKPIDQELFMREMKRVLDKYYFQNDFYILEDRRGNTVAIRFKDIMYMKSDKNMVQLCNSLSDEKIVFRASFYREAHKLERYDFLRCHRQYIINLRFVEKIDEKAILLRAGNKKVSVPIGKNRYTEISKKIRQFKARYICSNFTL